MLLNQVRDLKDIRRIAPDFNRGMRITDEKVMHLLKLTDAIWIHDGDMTKPHAELTSGKHSDAFVNVLQALKYSNICQLFGNELAVRLRDNYRGHVDWVVGSDHAGATLSYAVALALNVKHDFTEKVDKETHSWSRFQVAQDEKILQVEELITTGKTITRVRDAVAKQHDYQVEWVPVILTPEPPSFPSWTLTSATETRRSVHSAKPDPRPSGPSIIGPSSPVTSQLINSECTARHTVRLAAGFLLSDQTSENHHDNNASDRRLSCRDIIIDAIISILCEISRFQKKRSR